jgi:DNA-binding CsgD family transcriptional regulator
MHRDMAVPPLTPWEPWPRLTRKLCRFGVPVLAVGLGASFAAIAACVREGALAVLDPGQLTNALRAHGVKIGNQHRTGSTGIPAGLLSGRLPHPYHALTELTSSQDRVLYSMMRGASAQEIADHLVISLATVRSHIRSILGILGVTSQLKAVAMANGHYPLAFSC